MGAPDVTDAGFGVWVAAGRETVKSDIFQPEVIRNNVFLKKIKAQKLHLNVQ